MPEPSDPPRLEVQHATVRFGSVVAVDDVSVDVGAGQVLGVIGPNGAGKSSLLNGISGLVPLATGSVHLDGSVLGGTRPWERRSAGLARTFQLVEGFADFGAVEFVAMGLLRERCPTLLGPVLGLRSVRGRERWARDVARSTIDAIGMGHVSRSLMKELPYGTRKILDLVRATLGSPRLLLLDEPTSGCGTGDKERIAQIMGQLIPDGCATVVVDHNVGFIRAVAHQVLAMATGARVGIGTADEVLAMPEVRLSFTGEPADAGKVAESREITR